MDWNTHRPTRTNHFARLTVGIGCAMLCLIPFDMPILRMVEQVRLRGDVARLFDYCELFGHGLGVALIILTVIVLDTRTYRSASFLVIYAFGAGLLADAMKLVVCRTRPYYLTDLNIPIGETVEHWFPLPNYQSITQANTSFPSGHTATAFGLALALGILYPRGRHLFLGFATLAGIQRITSFAHYPTDVIGGVFVAFALASVLTSRSSITWKLLQNPMALADADHDKNSKRKCA